MTDQLRAYFDDVDRQQGAVDLDALRRSVEEGVITIELSPDKAVPPNGPTSGRRWPILIAAAAAAAVVVAIAVVATRDDDATPADQPSPTVTVPPTVPPQPLPNKFGPLAPGTYYVDEVDGTPTPRIFATIGTGWWDRCDQCEGWGIGKRVPHPDDATPGDDLRRFDETTFDDYLQRDIGGMSFSHPDAVYSDACHWESWVSPGARGHRRRSRHCAHRAAGMGRRDRPVGHLHRRLRRQSIPTHRPRRHVGLHHQELPHKNVGQDSGPHPDFRSWEIRGDFNAQYEPGQIETLWVLDLDGTMVVISTAASPEPSAGAPADFAADVLDSIRIERP